MEMIEKCSDDRFGFSCGRLFVINDLRVYEVFIRFLIKTILKLFFSVFSYWV